MKKKQHITAFYLEALMMIVVFISIILVLTQVFGSARSQSAGARRLTEAVTLAQNTAEAVSASSPPQDLQQILGGASCADLSEDGAAGEATVTVWYDTDMRPVQANAQAGSQDAADANAAGSETADAKAADINAAGSETADANAAEAYTADSYTMDRDATGVLMVQTRWMPASGARSGMIDARITVFEASAGSKVYELETSVFPSGK